MYLEETHMSMLLKDEAYDKLIRMINDECPGHRSEKLYRNFVMKKDWI